MASPSRLHPPTAHTPPAVPSPQGHPSLYSLHGGLLLARPEPHHALVYPMRKEAAHLRGGEDCWKDTEERPMPHLPLPHLAAPQVLCRG